MAAERPQTNDDNKLKATDKDIPVKDCNQMTDEQLMQAILNAGSSTNSGNIQGGTK